jgi:S1-C subfamily serine protease
MILIISTYFTVIQDRNYYGIKLNDLARQGNVSTNEVAALSKTVVQICDNSGAGSGVVIYADKLFIYILTNCHVVSNINLEEAYVKFVGNMFDTCVKNIIPTAFEYSSDLAIIVIPRVTENFLIAELAAETPNTGDEILNIGFPISIVHFCSRGTYTKTNSRYFFSSDLATAPGASGSPVFNKEGKLVGLIRAINLAPMPKTKNWLGCERENSILFLVRNSVGINLDTIKKFTSRVTKGASL